MAKWKTLFLFALSNPVLLLSLALSPFAAESWFPSLRFIDMRCIRFASIVHLPFVCIVQDIFWHFSRLAATPFVWNGLICIFSWVGFLAEAAAPLQMQSGSTDYWISNLWCLSVCLLACHGRWFQLIVKLPMTVCGTFVLEFAPWAGLRLSACSSVGWQSKGKRKSYARVESSRLWASSKSICDAPAYP